MILDVSYDAFQTNGFNKPILVKENDGLGLK